MFFSSLPKKSFFALGSFQNIISLHPVLHGPHKSWGGRGFIPVPCRVKWTLDHWTWGNPGFRSWQGISLPRAGVPSSAVSCPLLPAWMLPFTATLTLLNSFLTCTHLTCSTILLWSELRTPGLRAHLAHREISPDWTA